MCMGAKAPTLPPPAAPPPDAQDVGVVASRDSERARRRAAASKTVLTSPSGLSTPATVATKQLLGG